jgi:hypothetical protein
MTSWALTDGARVQNDVAGDKGLLGLEPESRLVIGLPVAPQKSLREPEPDPWINGTSRSSKVYVQYPALGYHSSGDPHCLSH